MSFRTNLWAMTMGLLVSLQGVPIALAETANPAPFAAGLQKPKNDKYGFDSRAMDDPNFENCNQECMQDKGVETLSQIALYNEDLIREAKDCLSSMDWDCLAFTRDYCSVEEKQTLNFYLQMSDAELKAQKTKDKGDNNEDPESSSSFSSYKTCLERFLKLKSFFLVKVKSALEAAQLTQKELKKNPVPKFEEIMDEESSRNLKRKYPQYPYFAKFDELVEFAKTHPSKAPQDWETLLASYEPQEKDFKSSSGIDKDAYENAKLGWAKFKGSFNMNRTDLSAVMSQQNERFKSRKSGLKTTDDAALLDQKLYNEVRGSLVRSAQGLVDSPRDSKGKVQPSSRPSSIPSVRPDSYWTSTGAEEIKISKPVKRDENGTSHFKVYLPAEHLSKKHRIEQEKKAAEVNSKAAQDGNTESLLQQQFDYLY